MNAIGIEPNGKFYRFDSIIEAIKGATGFTPVVECNVDAKHNSQLFQVYLCVDKDASKLIECPVPPNRRCASEVEFPFF